MIRLRRVNHVVLYVRDLNMMLDFYTRVLGLEIAERIGEDAVFLRIADSSNHHDLGLISVGRDALPVPEEKHAGLYHVAWEVEDLRDLSIAQRTLTHCGSFTGGSEHGTSLSLYGKDPEGNEFEIFWMVPRSHWNDREFGIRPLDLEAELATWTS